jgi:hypothetical protein
MSYFPLSVNYPLPGIFMVFPQPLLKADAVAGDVPHYS